MPWGGSDHASSYLSFLLISGRPYVNLRPSFIVVSLHIKQMSLIFDTHMEGNTVRIFSAPSLVLIFCSNCALFGSGTSLMVRLMRVSTDAEITQEFRLSLFSHAGFAHCGQPFKVGSFLLNFVGRALEDRVGSSKLPASAYMIAIRRFRNLDWASSAQLSTRKAGQATRVGSFVPAGNRWFSSVHDIKNRIMIVLPIPVWSATKALYVLRI